MKGMVREMRGAVLMVVTSWRRHVLSVMRRAEDHVNVPIIMQGLNVETKTKQKMIHGQKFLPRNQ